MNVYAFEELAGCFVFGDFKMPQTWTRAHRQCTNPEGGRESGPPPPRRITSSIGFYRKMQFGPITLEKFRPPEIFDPPPPSGLFKNYSSFEIALGLPL